MAELLMINPRKRSSKKRKSSTGIVKRARRSIASRVSSIRRRRRSNPAPRADVFNQFKDGAIGALGALAVDVAMQKLPIPVNFKTGQLAPITSGLVGIGIGYLLAKAGKKQLGKQMAAGGVTVSLYRVGRQMLAPTLGLSGVNDGLLGYDDGLLGTDDGLGEYFLNDANDQMNGGDDGLSAYIDQDQGMGYITGAPIVGYE